MKRRYAAVLCGLLAFLLVCTYVSSQVYRRSLPVVATGEQVNTTLSYPLHLTGTVSYSTPTVFSLPVACRVERAAAAPGDILRAGDLILQLDTRVLRMEWLELRLRLEQQSARTASSDWERELYQMQREDLEEQLHQVELLMEDEGRICAGQGGTLLSCAQPGDLPAGTALATVGESSGEKTITFYLEEKLAGLTTGARAEVTVPVSGKEETLLLPVKQVAYSAQRGAWRAVLETGEPLTVLEGQAVPVELTLTSREYAYVIPRSAVVELRDGNASFYVLREREGFGGTETYAALVSAAAYEWNELYVAINLPVTEPVIVSWDRPVESGGAVLVGE